MERLVHVSPHVCLGEFRCEPTDPLFRGGCCSGHTIVFPRTPVWIRHDGGRRRLIDASLITFYNQDQAYERWRAHGADRCDWLAFPDSTVREAVALFDPQSADRKEGPFRDGIGPSTPRLYLAQRRLFASLDTGKVDAAEVEETAMHLLHQALECQYTAASLAPRWCAPPPMRDAVDRVRQLIAADPVAPAPLARLADDVRVSVYYLCHAFRRITGTTMTAYRNRLRLLASLERLTPGADLTGLALDLGFSSHSHFTFAFRRMFGVTPSHARATTPPRAAHH